MNVLRKFKIQQSIHPCPSEKKKQLVLMHLLAVHHHGDVPVHSTVVIIAVLSDDPYHLYQLLSILRKLLASPFQELVLIQLQDICLLLQDSKRIHMSADNDITDIHAEEKDLPLWTLFPDAVSHTLGSFLSFLPQFPCLRMFSFHLPSTDCYNPETIQNKFGL